MITCISRDGKTLFANEALPTFWVDVWPTYMAGEIAVSEGPGSVEGSIFCFWIGNLDPAAPDVSRKVTEFVSDHDVVGIRFIRALPDKVHPAIEAEFEAARKILEALPAAAKGPAGRKLYLVAGEEFDVEAVKGMLMEGFFKEGERPSIRGIYEDQVEAARAIHNADGAEPLSIFQIDYADQMTLAEIRMFFGC